MVHDFYPNNRYFTKDNLFSGLVLVRGVFADVGHFIDVWHYAYLVGLV